MALAAENAVKQAETAVIVGYSVSFIDAENANHLIFHTQTGKVLEGTSLNVSFPEQIIGSDGHIWKSAVQSPQIFELYGTGTEKIYIKYERGGKVPEIGAEEDTAMLALRKRLERWKQSAWEAECAIFGREDAAVSGSGAGVGVVVDGCPAGLALCEEDVQRYLDRRKPGQSRFTTKRSESDTVEILSGVFEGRTTGTPISMLVWNQDQHSKDYSEIASYYRPGHADYTFDEKYGFRDYRGGGRSSGRETIGRVAAGAIAAKLLESLNIRVKAYTKAIGPVEVAPDRFDLAECEKNKLYMPDAAAAAEAEQYLERKMAEKDSAGGIVECVIAGLPAGLGEPVFDKFNANLAKAICSIGAVKGFEIGEGFHAAQMAGSENNDAFVMEPDGSVGKATNHAGGILGGMTDGSEVVFRAAFKPTPSIAAEQRTVNKSGEEIGISIKGRHDPIIVPRAVVVVETMAAFAAADMLLGGMTARLDRIQEFYRK